LIKNKNLEGLTLGLDIFPDYVNPKFSKNVLPMVEISAYLKKAKLSKSFQNGASIAVIFR